MNQISATRFTAGALLVITCLIPLIFSGCGKYREELDQAKQDIERLTSANKQLTEKVGRLETEKSKLDTEVKELRESNESLNKDLENLKRTHAQVLKEKGQLEDNAKALQQDIQAVKSTNDDLRREIEGLKAALAPPAISRIKKEEIPVPKDSLIKSEAVQPEKPAAEDPCEALVQYMRQVAAAVRIVPKEERSQRLEQLKREYGPIIQSAPAKAKVAAESWVTELVQGWDKPGDDIVYSLLRKRDEALKACKREPGKAGF